MKERFEEMKLELIAFGKNDVIATSNPGDAAVEDEVTEEEE